MTDIIRERFDQAATTILQAKDHLINPLAEASRLIVESLRGGGGVLLFGNGGSAADAQHIAGELVGRFLVDRPALRAVALTTDTSVLTCVGNDYDYEQVFARQVEAQGRKGDVAVGLSTSGNSPNVVAALTRAREMGLRTIAFTGPGGGRCAEWADVLLDVPGDIPTPRVQEAHVVAYHVLCELVEAAMVAQT
jgi:D-sedoheptulose 7-phosphate isomerase